MNDLATFNNIVDNAIAHSSYITVLISSCIFIIYTIIIKVVEILKAKDRNKPLLAMVESIKEVSENVVRLNNVLDKTFKNAEIKEINKVKNVITIAFDSFRVNVNKTCEDIIIHNNIKANEDSITQNICKLVNTEYYKLYSVLSAYEINDLNVSFKLKEEWIDEITNEIIDIIYNDQSALVRINQLSNKLQLIVNEHCIYVNNKVFNN